MFFKPSTVLPALFSFVLITVGCVPSTQIEYGFRPNTTVSKKDNDSFECKLASTQQVPTNNQVSTTPVYTTPVVCNNIGGFVSCTGGQSVGGNVITTDVNAGLRSQFFHRCMALRGYSTTVGVPICSEKQKQNLTEKTKAALRFKTRPYKKGACAVVVTQNATNLLYEEEQ